MIKESSYDFESVSSLLVSLSYEDFDPGVIVPFQCLRTLKVEKSDQISPRELNELNRTLVNNNVQLNTLELGGVESWYFVFDFLDFEMSEYISHIKLVCDQYIMSLQQVKEHLPEMDVAMSSTYEFNSTQLILNAPSSDVGTLKAEFLYKNNPDSTLEIQIQYIE